MRELNPQETLAIAGGTSCRRKTSHKRTCSKPVTKPTCCKPPVTTCPPPPTDPVTPDEVVIG